MPNLIQVNRCQLKNPILKFIKNPPYQWNAHIIPDYVSGPSTCVLFLSLRYHKLKPRYITGRLAKLKSSYQLRVLLCLVDLDDCENVIEDITTICFLNRLTLVCCWSSEECGRYLESLKALDQKDPKLLLGQTDNTEESRVSDVLTTIRQINKTDVATLIGEYGSLAGISKASGDNIKKLPGFGTVKTKKLVDVFNLPFKKK